MPPSPSHYEPAPGLADTLDARLRRFPRRPDTLVYAARAAAAAATRAWLRTYHRLRILGRENLPAPDRSFILVANHASHLDALCLLAALPLRQIHTCYPAAARDCFFVSLPRAAFSAIVINALPFARRLRVRQSLDLCARLLAQPGHGLIVFPEGTRSPTGRLGEFRSGVGMLAAGRNIPVIPCALHGCFAAWPKHARIPRPHPIRVVIGPPRHYHHLPPSRQSADTIAQDLQSAVAEMLEE